MATKKPATTSKTGGGEKPKQTSDPSKDAVRRQRSRIRMVQNVLLIWLDKNIDDKSADCRNTLTQLRRVVNTINTFNDCEQCIEFLKDIHDDNVCMIISGSLGKNIMPRVHNMSQVYSIFIFCGNKQQHEQWIKDWSKIKGLFTDILPICEALKKVTQQCEHNATSISMMTTSNNACKTNLDQLHSSFMYTQILKEILLTIKFKKQHINEFIDYCRDVFDDNKDALVDINKFEENYSKETPIWWYTFECFLYPMLNRALRLMEMDVIIKMGFFIDDLHRHIEQLHSEQFGNSQSGEILTVYRGQSLSMADFEQMQKTKGGLISFNNFLSTSKRRDVSLNFARDALLNPDMIGILFVMTIDRSKSTAPFASLNDVSCYKDTEDEILFSMHTIFRIQNIIPINEKNRLFQVDLTLTNDNDEDLRTLTQLMREDLLPDEEGWYRLTKLLLRMGQPENAQEICEFLLNSATDVKKKGLIYFLIGWAKDDQGKYQDALQFQEKSLEIRQKTLPPNHLDLAHSYNHIGALYHSMRNYSKALSYYEKALEIRRQSLPPNHRDLAKSYTNIGAVYNLIGEYSKALSSHKKALEMRQQSLPTNHPDLAMSYNNIGMVYNNMGDYAEARSFYEHAVDIAQRTLPPNHPHIRAYRNNLDRVK
ncbi:unnamed protein product [Rotaria sp. Silwood1]|nr:unnamed protein product [Rotaria sp. Silwood1]CAF1667744.1 unnamed protein product [Rotaria sp. Silwood1]